MATAEECRDFIKGPQYGAATCRSRAPPRGRRARADCRCADQTALPADEVAAGVPSEPPRPLLRPPRRAFCRLPVMLPYITSANKNPIHATVSPAPSPVGPECCCTCVHIAGVHPPVDGSNVHDGPSDPISHGTCATVVQWWRNTSSGHTAKPMTAKMPSDGYPGAGVPADVTGDEGGVADGAVDHESSAPSSESRAGVGPGEPESVPEHLRRSAASGWCAGRPLLHRPARGNRCSRRRMTETAGDGGDLLGRSAILSAARIRRGSPRS